MDIVVDGVRQAILGFIVFNMDSYCLLFEREGFFKKSGSTPKKLVISRLFIL
ncbi:MAG: hypothetical protein JW787_15700 [Sedimentisphaerales bacterium]|nr:hypothetical protein [Sedimentisphaerales bacterium]